MLKIIPNAVPTWTPTFCQRRMIHADQKFRRHLDVLSPLSTASLVSGERATPAPTARGAANTNVGSVEEAVPCHISLTCLGPSGGKDNGHVLEVELPVRRLV